MRRNAAAFLLSLGALLLASGANARAQSHSFASGAAEPDRRTLEAVRFAAGAPTIDGRLDEAAWSRARVATGFVQQAPRPGAPATERTGARVLYDDRALYVGVRLHDAAPDSIIAHLARRDEEPYSDWFYVALDSYHDRRTAFVFGVNAAGVERDLVIHDDAQEDSGWDAVWEADVRIDSLGWTAELRIPLSQLRFTTRTRSRRIGTGAGAADGLVWGLNFRRHIARRGETDYWSPVPPDAAGVVSLFGELRGLAGLEPPRRLEIRPYTVARVSRAPGAAADPFHRRNDLFGSAGANLRYGATSDLTLTATFNPDFGQVEADPSVVNLTAYESFFPEKRPFFLEGAEIFQSGWPRLFYSRRIGREPQLRLPDDAVYSNVPAATTILGAAKLTGKTAGGWSVGILNAVTAGEDAGYVDENGSTHSTAVEPLTNYAVARVVKDAREGRSAVGATFTATNRRLDGAAGRDLLRSAAYAGGLDARHRFGGGDYELETSLNGSLITGTPGAIARVQRASGHYYQRPDASHLEYDPTRTSLTGWAGRLRLAKIGGGHWRWQIYGSASSPGFEMNDLGFNSSTDVATASASVAYEQYRPGRLFRRWEVSSFLLSRWSFGGERELTVWDLTFDAQLHDQWGVYGWYQHDFAAVSTDALRGGPALARPSAHRGYLSVSSDPRRPLTGSLSGFLEVEEDGAGYRLYAAPSLSYRPSTRLDLSLRPSYARNVNAWQYVAREEAGGRTHHLIGRLDQTTLSLTGRLDYTFTPDLSLQLYAQPFISAGAYSEFKDVDDADAARFEDRFRTFDMNEVAFDPDAGRYTVDLDADGSVDLAFDVPDFNTKQLRASAVLRWEYRPGSTLFLVWSHGRSAHDPVGSFDLGRDVDGLFGAPATNVLLVKVNYWLSL